MLIFLYKIYTMKYLTTLLLLSILLFSCSDDSDDPDCKMCYNYINFTNVEAMADHEIEMFSDMNEAQQANPVLTCGGLLVLAESEYLDYGNYEVYKVCE